MNDIVFTTTSPARRSEPLVFKVVHGVPKLPDLPAPAFPDATNNVLDPLKATTGTNAVIAYTMTPQDRIVLTYNGKAYPEQSGNTNGSVTFRITAADIAASIGKTVQVSYHVIRGDDTGTSAVLSLQVSEPAQGNLPKPDITEAKEGVLDVTQLGDSANLTVQPWPLMAAGQRMSLRFEGTKADGNRYNWNHPQWQGEPVSDTSTQRTTVQGVHLKVLEDNSTLRMVFEVSFDGGGSKIAFPISELTIKAVADIPRLPAPVVPAASDGVLDPLQAITGTDAVVRYGMLPEDRISLSYDGNEYAEKRGDETGEVNFSITAADIAASIGKQVVVSYRVRRGGQSSVSDSLNVRVSTPAPQHWPQPVITEAVNGDLNIANLSGDAHLTVEPWRFQALGQLLYLRFEGVKADGNPASWSHPDWQGKPVTALGTQRTEVSLAQLKTLRSGSALKVILEVSFDGGKTRIPFKGQGYVIITWSLVVDFEGEADRALQTITYYTIQGARFYVYFNSPTKRYTGSISTIPTLPDLMQGKGLLLDTRDTKGNASYMTVTFPRRFTKLRFAMQYAGWTDSWAYLFDENGESKGGRLTIPRNYTGWLEPPGEAGRSFDRVAISISPRTSDFTSRVYLDNFMVQYAE